MDPPPTITALRGDTYVTLRETAEQTGEPARRRRHEPAEPAPTGETPEPLAEAPPLEERPLEIRLRFDPDRDVLSAWLGDTRDTIEVEAEEGIRVRVKPDTSEVVAFTVPEFRRRFLGQPGSVLSIPLLWRPLAVAW